MMHASIRLSAFLSMLAVVFAASAQSYPSRPITMVVPSGVGATHDILARTLGKPLGDRMGTSVIIENRGT